jgi:hypothetical protein
MGGAHCLLRLETTQIRRSCGSPEKAYNSLSPFFTI